MYKPDSIKGKLMTLLKDQGVLSRKDAYEWSRKNHHEQATTERICRSLVEENGVVALNDELQPKRLHEEHIWGWKFSATTKFNKKLC